MSYSHSALSLYRACPLRYRLHYLDHLEPRQPPSAHDAEFGKAWHAGIAGLYASGSVMLAIEAFTLAYPESAYPLSLPDRSKGKTFANGIQALAAYAERWRDEDAYWDVLQVEQLENFDGNDERALRLDLVVRDKRDGLIYGVDTKTTSSYLDAKFWERYEPDSQVRTYTDHIKNQFGHGGGFIINAASFKYRSKAYTPRAGQPNAGIQQPAGAWHAFARMMFNPNEDCLQLERENFLYWQARVESDRQSSTWGYNTQSCHMYGQECEYYKICSNGYSWPRDTGLIENDYWQRCAESVEGERCWLALNHEGACDSTKPERPVQVDYEVDLSEEIEDAISD